MKYQMRRKDREESRETALQVIDKASFGVMATVDSDGEPYCTPLSFVRDGEVLYFHCALSGHKIDNLKRDPRVCVSFTGEISFPEDDFTVVYESATVMGTAKEVTEDEEKIRGLRLLCERFTPKNMAAFDGAIAKSLAATGVWKISIGDVSAKRRKHPA
ncbi:MAG: pyridoxamine 5'-phosphate oxidase family protein [Treponema sp.]|jgi:nitroimidazol reductase NimA-like FMN-containing flavoprotein (pyridoxamine 5'-phosphate oxidase superfamily)|nr:pyridoxamine 5'-phosphate oxidase family protein [Treponema sp.]